MEISIGLTELYQQDCQNQPAPALFAVQFIQLWLSSNNLANTQA